MANWAQGHVKSREVVPYERHQVARRKVFGDLIGGQRDVEGVPGTRRMIAARLYTFPYTVLTGSDTCTPLGPSAPLVRSAHATPLLRSDLHVPPVRRSELSFGPWTVIRRLHFCDRVVDSFAAAAVCKSPIA
jgi:hypothetical protein